MKNKKIKRNVRHARVRKKIGTKSLPRLVIFRSNKYIYAQVVDIRNQATLAFASDLKIKGDKSPKTDKARQVGLNLAKGTIAKKVDKVVFDRAGYKYHGRVKALAEGAREGGLKF